VWQPNKAECHIKIRIKDSISEIEYTFTSVVTGIKVVARGYFSEDSEAHPAKAQVVCVALALLVGRLGYLNLT
jgi:hypothetical protein